MKKKTALLIAVTMLLAACSVKEAPAAPATAESTQEEKQKPEEEQAPRKIKSVEFDRTSSEPPQLVDRDLTFVLSDGTKIQKTFSTSSIFDEDLYLDLTGDGVDEFVLKTEFGNTAGDWDLVQVFQLEGDDIVEIFPVSDITELGDQMFNTTVVPCGKQGLPPFMLEVETRTKAGTDLFTTAHEMLVWQDGKFEILKDYEMSAKERFERYTVENQAAGLGYAVSRAVESGVPYDKNDAESVWTCIFNCITAMPEPVYSRLDVSAEYEQGKTTYTVSSEVVSAYAGALFVGMETLPEVPESVNSVTYDAAEDVYIFVRDRNEHPNLFPVAETLEQEEDGSFTARITAKESYDAPIESDRTYRFVENPDPEGRHIFPYALSDEKKDIADLPVLEYFDYTTDELISAFGDDYEVMYWTGSVLVLYEKDIGIHPGTYNVADLTFDGSSRPNYILVIGDRPLLSTPEGHVVHSGTWPQMKEEFGKAGITTAEPEFFHNEMDDIDEYALEFDYDGHHFYCEWFDDPQTNHCGIITIRARDV